jgi:hypothetical protein
MSRKRRCGALIIGLLFLLPGLAQAATMTNDRLQVDVDEDSARIFLAAVGEAVDETIGETRSDLLFFDRPPSSYTVVYVDGDALIFGSERGTFSKRAVLQDSSIDAVWTTARIDVEQTLRFVRRKESGVEDGVLIEYRVENRSARDLEVGLRVLFDTRLGESDGYHFLLPGGVQVRTETEFLGSDLPRMWTSTGGSSLCLTGTLAGEAVSPPDRIVFANYRALRENLLRYRIRRMKSFDYTPYSINDSAVALYYDPRMLPPGASRTYRTILGLCGEGEFTLESAQPRENRELQALSQAVRQGPAAGSGAPAPAVPLAVQPATPGTDGKSDPHPRHVLMDSLKQIDEVIETLNDVLETEDKSLSSEDAARLERTLDELGGGSR